MKKIEVVSDVEEEEVEPAKVASPDLHFSSSKVKVCSQNLSENNAENDFLCFIAF